jgi:murein DD-endopeptidase MepM/ murein hydrolase activator NlpD
MKFRRPVGREFPYAAQYGDWGPWWSKHIDSTGMWVMGQKDGMGQHKGIDFKVPDNTLVHSICDGIVVASGWENPSDPKQGFGQRVRQHIVTDAGVAMTVVYGHFSQLYVRPGQQVYLGDRLGFSGHTGHVTGPHLHIELIDGRGQYHPIVFEDDPPVQLEKPTITV